jgi:low temperature requirement protein LtrA
MNADFFEVVLLFLLPSVAASYFASVLCRLVHLRHHHVRWWLGPASTVGACVLVGCFVWLGSSLQPGQDPMGMGFTLCVTCVPGSLLAAVPAHMVVWHYRRTYCNIEHVV